VRSAVSAIDYHPRHRLEPQLALARERLARIEPGGAPSRPVDVDSASQIEVRAESTPCLRCQGPYRIDEHTAECLEGEHVRVIHARCHHCGARRVMYFRVRPALPS
jgi:hypothetical protein